MDEISWDGLTTEEAIGAEASRLRHRLADAAKAYRWQDVFAALEQDPKMVNAVRPGSKTLFAPLHQAAHAGAPREVVDRLVHTGAWRMLANAAGETPRDIAIRDGHTETASSLQPHLAIDAARAEMVALEARFHEVIRGRAAELIVEYKFRLPQLAPVLEFERTKWWFAVPGMAGGFAYWLEKV